MKQSAVGAFSLDSLEFLVPVAAAVESEEAQITVLITDFDPRYMSVADVQGQNTYSPHYSLPLPMHPKGESIDYVPVYGHSKQELQDALSLWTQRFAANVRAMGDNELANAISANGQILVQRVGTSDYSVSSPADALRCLVQVTYELVLPSSTIRVETIGRPLFLPAGPDTCRNIQTALMVLHGSLPQSESGYGRAHVRIRVNGRDYVIKEIREHKGEQGYHLVARDGQIFEVRFTTSSALLFAIDGNNTRSVRGQLNLYGEYTLVRVTEFGCLAHAPWYVSLLATAQNSNSAETRVLPVIEYISPFNPTDRRRAAYPLGSGTRLSPSGCTLFDYDEGNVGRLLNVLLGIPRRPPSDWWLIKLIVEWAHGGHPVNSPRARRASRLVAFRLMHLFRRQLEDGKSFVSPQFVSQAAKGDFRLDVSLESLFKLWAMFSLYRKIGHPCSTKMPPPQTFMRSLRGHGWVSVDSFDMDELDKLIIKILRQLYYRAKAQFSICRKDLVDQALSNMDSWMRRPRSYVVEYSGLRVDIPDKIGWYYHRRADKSLERVVADLIVAVWHMSETFGKAHLWTLLLLLGPTSARQAIHRMISFRLSPKLAGQVILP